MKILFADLRESVGQQLDPNTDCTTLSYVIPCDAQVIQGNGELLQDKLNDSCSFKDANNALSEEFWKAVHWFHAF